ncbi:serine/threonine-protein kinase [Spirillospora sp. CA-255316]
MAEGVPSLPAKALPRRDGDPERIGDYEVLGFLGEGGMGSVYLGRGPAGGTDLVAVKVVRADHARHGPFRERFRREAASALKVPRFCTAEVLDAGPDAERPYLVTEFIDGPTLDEAVEEGGPLRRAELEQLGVSMAAALAGIHGAGVVHRDLKPSNVLLSRMGPRVIDFGIASALDVTHQLTATGQIIGTPAYMAPEQFEGEGATEASDVFAWGSVMAYAATGRRAFGTGPSQAIAYRIVHGEPDLEGVEEPMRGVVAAALAKDPAARPTARELLSRLGVPGGDPAAAAGRPGAPLPPPGGRSDLPPPMPPPVPPSMSPPMPPPRLPADDHAWRGATGPGMTSPGAGGPGMTSPGAGGPGGVPTRGAGHLGRRQTGPESYFGLVRPDGTIRWAVFARRLATSVALLVALGVTIVILARMDAEGDRGGGGSGGGASTGTAGLAGRYTSDYGEMYVRVEGSDVWMIYRWMGKSRVRGRLENGVVNANYTEGPGNLPTGRVRFAVNRSGTAVSLDGKWSTSGELTHDWDALRVDGSIPADIAADLRDPSLFPPPPE